MNLAHLVILTMYNIKGLKWSVVVLFSPYRRRSPSPYYSRGYRSRSRSRSYSPRMFKPCFNLVYSLNEIAIVIKSSHMLFHWSGLDQLQKLSFMKCTHGICDKNQVWHLISFPVILSQVTTEQREKSRRQIQCYCLDACPKGLSDRMWFELCSTR